MTHLSLLTQLEGVLVKLRAVLGALVMASCVDSGHLVATTIEGRTTDLAKCYEARRAESV